MAETLKETLEDIIQNLIIRFNGYIDEAFFI